MNKYTHHIIYVVTQNNYAFKNVNGKRTYMYACYTDNGKMSGNNSFVQLTMYEKAVLIKFCL